MMYDFDAVAVQVQHHGIEALDVVVAVGRCFAAIGARVYCRRVEGAYGAATGGREGDVRCADF